MLADETERGRGWGGGVGGGLLQFTDLILFPCALLFIPAAATAVPTHALPRWSIVLSVWLAHPFVHSLARLLAVPPAFKAVRGILKDTLRRSIVLIKV